MTVTVCVLVTNAVYFSARMGAEVCKDTPETVIPMALGMVLQLGALVALWASS